MKIKMGRIYKDSVSGWIGMAVSKHKYMNGCVRWELNAADKDGKPTGFVFDEQQIVEVDDQPVTVTATAGGPRDHTPVPR